MRARPKSGLLLTASLFLAMVQGIQAESFDTLVGAVAPQGGAYLVKRFAVPGGSIISGAVIYSNDVRTTFPKVLILEGSATRIAGATVLARVEDVRPADGRRRIVVSFPPIVVASPQDLYVAVELPASEGILDLGDGAGVGAWDRGAPTDSYFASAADTEFGPMEVDYGIELVYQVVGKTKPEVLRTFLRTGSPNPAAGRTRIEFGVEQAGSVTLVVYDVGGRRVRTLTRDALEPGAHVRFWDGRDDRGREVAAGIYLVRLATQGRVLTQKLVVAR